MKKKHTYQAGRVQQVRVAELFALLMAGCIVAVDIAKTKMLVALATMTGEVVKLFRFDHPTETSEFLRIVTELRAGVEGGKVEVAMEPTGTYGDALRYQVEQAGAQVFMVSPKRTHDSQALFDNVSSLHDPKSAVLIAKLHAMGLSTKWEAPPQSRLRLRALVDLRRYELDREDVCHGRLEGALSRYWPELGQCADVREQKSALHLLVKYPSPADVNADPEGVEVLLREASRGRFSAESIQGVLVGAQGSLGVPMEREEKQYVQALASQMLEAGNHMHELEREMDAVVGDDEVYARWRPWMGAYTAACMLAMCDPRQYPRARQLEKGCGLNMKEKSSGQHQGRVSITKRGPGLVRQLMYLFACRMIKDNAVVRAWYERRKGYTDGSKKCAIVAVTRKLVRAAFHVAHGATFDASKLFDVRRLKLDAAKAPEETAESSAVQASSTAQESNTTQESSTATPTPTNSAMPPTPSSSATPTTTPKSSSAAAMSKPSSAAATPTSSSTATPTSSNAAATSNPSSTATPTPASTETRKATSTPRSSSAAATSKRSSTAAPKSSSTPKSSSAAATPKSSSAAATPKSSSAAATPNPSSTATPTPASAAAQQIPRRVAPKADASPMTLDDVQAAARAAAAACGRAPSAQTTPRPIARDNKRARNDKRAQAAKEVHAST